jgi:hypothetical protein
LHTPLAKRKHETFQQWRGFPGFSKRNPRAEVSFEKRLIPSTGAEGFEVSFQNGQNSDVSREKPSTGAEGFEVSFQNGESGEKSSFAGDDDDWTSLSTVADEQASHEDLDERDRGFV